MKTIPAPLNTHLQGSLTTLCTCWKVTLSNDTVLGFTDHNEDVIVDGVTYRSSESYNATNVQSSNNLNVDNMEVHGVLSSPSITEDDLRAGVWDYAKVSIFSVNYVTPGAGKLSIRDGSLGQVSLAEPGLFTAELRGLMAYYARTLGELTSPTCRASLGDTRCGFPVESLKVTSTISSVSADGLALYDPARIEPGPSDSVTITSISSGGGDWYVSYSGAFTPALVPGEAVVISGVLPNMAELNNITIAETPAQSSTTGSFRLPLPNGTTLGAYNGGGKVARLGQSGYFDYGRIKFISGLNVGLSREVKAYVPGQIQLQLPFPYAIASGDIYEMWPGCDKTFPTCRDRFNNTLNFRGEPYVPGINKIVQVGRHNG